MERLVARARLRLLRDLRVLQEEPLQGVAAEPLENDVFVWHANLQYDGESMHFEILVPKTYPAEAPAVFFPTGLPHPNCFPRRTPDGRDSYAICLNMLGNEGPSAEVGSGWSSAYDLRGLLVQLQAFILDDHNQYHRAGGLSMRQAITAARRYCCPSCPHRPGKAAPSPKRAGPCKRPSLLRSLAPPCSSAVRELPRNCSHIPLQRKVSVELKPWRDVQRLASHAICLAAPMTPSFYCIADDIGFQKPKKSKAIRLQNAAEMSNDMWRYKCALKIQTFVRRCLARLLIDCLRRVATPGMMSIALKAAYVESTRIDNLATSLNSRLANAQTAEENVKHASMQNDSLEQRALAIAREELAKKRRRLEKKLRQIDDTTAKTVALTEEEAAKLAKHNVIVKELKILDCYAPCPSALSHCSLSPEEKKDAETSGFYELFIEAVRDQREASQKTKSKARQERRFAQLAATPVVAKASSWAKHMDIARTAFIEIRCRQRNGEARKNLTPYLVAWHRAASSGSCPRCGLEMFTCNMTTHMKHCGRPNLSACKDGTCHLLKVPYVVQVGLIYPMMAYRELLTMATLSRTFRTSAEDGCLWSTQMSRCYPLSSLTPKVMENWKYAFQCELRQAISSLECFHSKINILDTAAVVLGIPIEFTINPKTETTDYIYSTMDHISYDAFSVDGVRKTVYNEVFSHWLPLYLSEDHWRRAFPHLRRAVLQLLPHRRCFHPEMVIEVFVKMINTLVVLICDKGLSFSERAAKAYCSLHRLALRCIQEWPELQRHIDDRVDCFCRSPQYRSKDVESNLGEFMALLLLSSRPWSRVAPHALEERMDREVLWMCTECPSLANLSGGAAPSDELRREESWKAKVVGKRLFAFQVSCLTLFKEARNMDDIARDYDRFYGQPSQAFLNKFRLNTQSVLAMNDWDAFFGLVRVKAPSPEKLAEMLRTSVKNSRKRGYHTDGMDFNRVHASGTSKILRKGESYMAAATLKAVDLEDHWSWADGSTKFLDATCLVYDCSHKHVGHLDYQKTSMTVANGRPIKRGVLSHSGDQLDDAKQSGFHQIHVQLDGLPSNVQYLYITVSAWDGAKLRDIQQPSVRLLESGAGELCRYDVEGADGNKTSILMCVLHRRPERSTSQVSRWALEAIGEVGFGAADNYGPILEMVEGFRRKKGW